MTRFRARGQHSLYEGIGHRLVNAGDVIGHGLCCFPLALPFTDFSKGFAQFDDRAAPFPQRPQLYVRHFT